MNAFDDTLNALQHAGQVLLAEGYAAPWAVHIPEAETLRRHLRIDPYTRIVPFHQVRRGSFSLQLAGEASVTVAEGEVAIVFGGNHHLMYEGAPTDPIEFADIATRRKEQTRPGAGTDTELICGVFLMRNARGNPLFEALPPLLRADMAGHTGGRALQALADLLARELAAPLPGHGYMCGRLLQMICAEAIRDQMERAAHSGPNWFAALRDRKIGTALNVIHASPASPITVADLAERTGMSGSRFAARFREKTGQSPIRQPRKPLVAISLSPFIDGPDTDPHGAGNVIGAFAAFQPPNQHFSTFRRETGILVHVHSVLHVELRLLQTSASQGWIE